MDENPSIPTLLYILLHSITFYYILLHSITFYYTLLHSIRDPHRFEHLGDGSHGAVDILIGSLPVADADPHCAAAAPGRSAKVCLPVPNDRGNHPIGPPGMILFGGARPSIKESDQPLVDDRLPHNLGARQGADTLDQSPRVAAAALD